MHVFMYVVYVEISAAMYISLNYSYITLHHPHSHAFHKLCQPGGIISQRLPNLTLNMVPISMYL